MIGIDPGLSGAVARLGSEGEIIRIHDMPVLEVTRGGKKKRELDFAALADLLDVIGGAGPAFVEQVGAMPGQGVTSMFSFGKTYGGILGVLAAFQIPVTHVTPQKWKKQFSVRPGKDGSRLRASELFPADAHWFSRAKDDGRAEAALIALYGFVNQ